MRPRCDVHAHLPALAAAALAAAALLPAVASVAAATVVAAAARAPRLTAAYAGQG